MKMMDSIEGRIAYRLAGPADGPLLVLIHGMGDTGVTYRLLTPRLAAAGYRVADHYPHAEMPAATAEGLLAFLAGTRSPARIAS